jgi:hypothetical protein
MTAWEAVVGADAEVIVVGLGVGGVVVRMRAGKTSLPSAANKW